MFSVPRVVFTLQGNQQSEGVIEALRQLQGSSLASGVKEEQDYRVFARPQEIQEYFEGGVSPSAALVLFDSTGSRCFRMMTRSREDDRRTIPSWACGVQWAVGIHKAFRAEGCAKQIRADFWRRFSNQLARGEFPWGMPRKREAPPRQVVLPDKVDDIIAELNKGPDLVSAIAQSEYALELPTGSRISWFRVAAEPITCDEEYLTKVVGALRNFERICDMLARSQAEVHPWIFAGVNLPSHLHGYYLFPPSNCFSVGRPDLHYRGTGLFASEIDEMPGGFAELAHIDHAYGVNQDRWQRCFEWLAKEGPVLFLVSHAWSKVYIPEVQWLVGYLQTQGYPAYFLATDRLEELSFRTNGVYYEGKRIGTIWRQFPIFETTGRLEEVVIAAQDSRVRLVPEFAHFGNKVWFSLFWKYQEFFQTWLGEETHTLLQEVLPDSSLVVSEKSFPCVVAGKTIGSIHALRELAEDGRNSLVLKICGANTLAARSYGVLMGHGLTQRTWQDWIDERIGNRQPFIIQRRVEAGIAEVAVKNTARNHPELFSCKILLRPWLVGDEIVSVHACAVPSNTLRVHGRVDMAVLPVEFGKVI